MTPPDFWLLGAIVISTIASIFGLKMHERWEQRQDVAREARDAERQAHHERRAVEREEKALKRHGDQMKTLADNRALVLAAIDQRSRLEFRTDWLEQAIENHADHLTDMGRDAESVFKIPPPRR
jgi:hypothetical protein